RRRTGAPNGSLPSRSYLDASRTSDGRRACQRARQRAQSDVGPRSRSSSQSSARRRIVADPSLRRRAARPRDMDFRACGVTVSRSA
ncbi:hypothetical protein IscW_ISCW001581, partial [Ixodes scapularis]